MAGDIVWSGQPFFFTSFFLCCSFFKFMYWNSFHVYSCSFSVLLFLILLAGVLGFATFTIRTCFFLEMWRWVGTTGGRHVDFSPQACTASGAPIQSERWRRSDSPWSSRRPTWLACYIWDMLSLPPSRWGVALSLLKENVQHWIKTSFPLTDYLPLQKTETSVIRAFTPNFAFFCSTIWSNRFFFIVQERICFSYNENSKHTIRYPHFIVKQSAMYIYCMYYVGYVIWI